MHRKSLLLAASISAAVVLAGIAGYELRGLRHAPAQATETSRGTIYTCPMHPTYLADKPGNCPICGMKLVPAEKAKPGATGQQSAADGSVTIDPSVVQNMGITTEEVQARSLTKEIHASTTIQMNETAVTDINTKIGGWVERLYVDYTGQTVKKGQPLLTVYSPDLVSAQEEYLQSLHYLNTLSQTATEARKGALDLVESGKRRLLNWDIPAREIERIAAGGAPQKTLTIYSPAQGVVLEKSVVAGQNIQPGLKLYKIADLSTVWAMASVYQQDLPFIKTGERAAIDVPSLPGRSFTGSVEFIAPVLDSSTRTAAVRIAIRNTPDFALKPQMFVNVSIASPASAKTPTVSEQAILHTGKRDLVIVSLGNGRFRPQEVTIGMNAGGYTQLLFGVTEGDTIVTSSQFMIDAESNLKAAVGQMGGMEMPGMEKSSPVKKEKNAGGMNMPGMQ